MPENKVTVNSLAVITKAAKDAAREELRAKAYLAVTGTIYRATQAFSKAKDRLLKESAEIEKDTRILEVEARELAADHPEKEEAVKEATEARAETDKRKEAIAKEVDKLTADNTKELEALHKDLADITSGEKKVDYDTVLARAEKLIALRIRAQHDAGDFDNTQETN